MVKIQAEILEDNKLYHGAWRVIASRIPTSKPELYKHSGALAYWLPRRCQGGEKLVK